MSRARRALVIGAGLAGSATAAALVQRGWNVTLVADAADDGASGVPVAVMAPTTGDATDPLTRLRRRGLAATRAWLRRLERAGHDAGRVADGVLLFPGSDRDRLRLDRIGAEDRPARSLTPDEVRTAAGIALGERAVLHPGGGCCRPALFARALRRHAGTALTIRQACVEAIDRANGHWRVFGADGARIGRAPVLVLAAGRGCIALRPETRRWLLPARGQATAFAATPETAGLRLPLSGGGYITPAVDGLHWAGATLQRGDDDAQARAADDERNLAFARERLGLSRTPAVADRFVGFRATTPNRLPAVGRLDGGLWIQAGHGAHGVMTAPLCGALLADAIAGRQHPLLRLLDPWTRRDGHAVAGS